MRNRMVTARSMADERLGPVLIPPADMSRDSSGSVVEMTFGEIGGRLPDLRYEGSKKGGVPHGNGKISHPCGIIWSGEFCDGTLPCGVMADGDMRYEGEFLNLWPHGRGRKKTQKGGVWTGRFEFGLIVEGNFSNPGIITYDGAFRKGSPHGMGKMAHLKSGRAWDGLFQDGRLMKGTVVFPNGVSGEGDFRDLNLHGKGRLLYPSGSEYSGGFRDGKKHGQGIYIDPADDRIIDGEWRDGKCVYGTIILHETEYEGQIEGIRPHGPGRASDGDIVLEGNFDRWAVNGECTITDKAGGCIEMFVRKSGEVELRSLRHGCCELVLSPGDVSPPTVKFPNGLTYTGAILHGRAQGAGELTIPGVGVCTGSFASGLLEGKAEVTFASGASLSADFHSGLPDGIGQYQAASGALYTGHFSDGLPCGPGSVFVSSQDSFLYFHVAAGLSPSCPALGLEELVTMREALAHCRVAFPAQVTVMAAAANGRGLYIDKVASGTLPDGGEPFLVVLAPDEATPPKADETRVA